MLTRSDTVRSGSRLLLIVDPLILKFAVCSLKLLADVLLQLN